MKKWKRRKETCAMYEKEQNCMWIAGQIWWNVKKDQPKLPRLIYFTREVKIHHGHDEKISVK